MPDAHDCDRGWLWVGQKYAEHIAAGMALGPGVPTQAVVAGLLNTVYPCKECQPDLFYRWARKHFATDHDVSSCPDCVEVHGGPKAARRHATAAGTRPGATPTENYEPDSPPPRRDIDG